MDRISDEERRRIAELLAGGAPVWRLHREINRSRHAIRRAVIALQRPARREPGRSPLRLSLAEREEISRGSAAGWGGPPRRCAGRWRPTAGQAGTGRVPRTGERSAWRTVPGRPSRPGARGCARWWRASWSGAGRSGQIAGWLTASYPEDPGMRVPHETIYLSLFVWSRGALRQELARYLRTGRARRRPRGLSVRTGQGQLRGTVHISAL